MTNPSTTNDISETMKNTSTSNDIAARGRAAWGSLDTPEAKKERANKLKNLRRQQKAEQKRKAKVMLKDLLSTTQHILLRTSLSLEADEHVRLKLVDREIELWKLRIECLKQVEKMDEQARKAAVCKQQEAARLAREKTDLASFDAIKEGEKARTEAEKGATEDAAAAKKRSEVQEKQIETTKQRRIEEDKDLKMQFDEMNEEDASTTATTGAPTPAPFKFDPTTSRQPVKFGQTTTPTTTASAAAPSFGTAAPSFGAAAPSFGATNAGSNADAATGPNLFSPGTKPAPG